MYVSDIASHVIRFNKEENKIREVREVKRNEVGLKSAGSRNQ